jgi:hypothetical protein
MNIAALPPETQIEVTAGARKKQAIKQWNVSAVATVIRGDRTASEFVTAYGNRTFMRDRLDLQLEVGYVGYDDNCTAEATAAGVCTGTAQGSTLRGGGALIFRRDRHWMFLADYRYSMNSATTALGGARPDISAHALFVRGQYTF